MRLSLWRASVLGVLAGLLSVPASELQILARPQQQQPPPLKVPAPKPPGEKYLTVARQLGRVSDDDWAEVQAAAAAAGKTFTAWSIEILLAAARARKA